MRKNIFLLIIFISVLIACNTGKQSGNSGGSADSLYAEITTEFNDYVITEKYWKLIELNGKNIPPVTQDMGREAHFVLHKSENRVSGNTGCNSMIGTYELSEDQGHQGEISFSQFATTRMACVDIYYEQEYLKVFEISKTYSIENDQLTFFSEENFPVAIFVAVSLQ